MDRKQAFVGNRSTHLRARPRIGNAQEIQQALQGAVFAHFARHGNDTSVGAFGSKRCHQIFRNVDSNGGMLGFFQGGNDTLAVFQ